MLVEIKPQRPNPYEEGAALARQIKSAMLSRMASGGVSKAELSRRMGVSSSYLAPLGAESPDVNLRKVSQACVALGVRAESVMAEAFASTL